MNLEDEAEDIISAINIVDEDERRKAAKEIIAMVKQECVEAVRDVFEEAAYPDSPFELKGQLDMHELAIKAINQL